MNVLSLFDGMSCARIALKELGIKVDKYFASEIDKYAIAQTRLNFPDTIQLGDVTQVDGYALPKIDLLVGGSPCQGFSFAGKQLNFKDPRSKLFFEYVRILKELRAKNPNIKFMLENVRMRKEYEMVITNELGLFPVCINSSLVSAQNRIRLYWTNIRTRTEGLFSEVYTDIPQPKDKGLLLKDILETEVDTKYYLSEKVINNMLQHLQRQKEKGNGFGIDIRQPQNKSCSLTVGGKMMRDLVQVPQYGIYQRPRGENKGGFIEGKAPTLTAKAGRANKIAMTFEELKAIANAKAEKAKPRHEESQIQRSCLRWFRLQYPQYALLCFAVPNGGARNKREASIMKAEGVTAGVADVILLIPSSGYASLCLEFKTQTGRQQDTQKAWQKAAETAGNKYTVIRSFDEFRNEVTNYLQPKKR